MEKERKEAVLKALITLSSHIGAALGACDVLTVELGMGGLMNVPSDMARTRQDLRDCGRRVAATIAVIEGN